MNIFECRIDKRHLIPEKTLEDSFEVEADNLVGAIKKCLKEQGTMEDWNKCHDFQVRFARVVMEHTETVVDGQGYDVDEQWDHLDK